MGIKDLVALIKAECPEQLRFVPVAEIAGYKIAVDVSIYLYKFVRAYGLGGWLDAFINFVCEVKKARLHPVYIFDGPNPPPEKRLEQEARRAELARQLERLREAERLYEVVTRTYAPAGEELPSKLQDEIRAMFERTKHKDAIRYSDAVAVADLLRVKIELWTNQTIRITPAFSEKAKDVLKLLGLPYLQAAGEAETLCAFLAVNAHVDAVLTSDSDILAYGAPCMLSDVGVERPEAPSFLGSAGAEREAGTSGRGARGQGGAVARLVYHRDLCDALLLAPDEFRDLCILLSCDYNKRVQMRGKKGKPLNIGKVRALELIRTHRTLEAVENFLIDPAPLNYERCRELFTVPEVDVEAKFEYAEPIAEADFFAFLRENRSRISHEFIKNLWRPPKLVVRSSGVQPARAST